MPDTGASAGAILRTEREDFQATQDPGLIAEGRKGDLLDYGELYALWERQHWRVQDIDLAQDRSDWHERIDAADREDRVYGFAAFFVGEQRVATELGPIMRACPEHDMRLFLGTQIADEARHVAFFDRYYREVGLSEAEGIGARLQEAGQHLNDNFVAVFDELLGSRVDRLATAPDDLETFVEAITLYHIVIEGMLALTGQHYTLVLNENGGTLPGLVEGFNNIARDEHRHVAFGVRCLRDMVARDPRYGDAVKRILIESAPAVDGVLKPPWYDEPGAPERFEATFGYSIAEAQTFALTALQRRLAVIGVSMTD